MSNWRMMLLPTLVVLVAAGIYVFVIHEKRKDLGVIGKQQVEEKLHTSDELAFVKKRFFASFDQAKDLQGTSVWIKAGYALPYYAYTGGAVQFSKRAGVLPAAEKLSITKLIKAVAPAKEDDRVPHGSRQYFVVFTLAGPDVKPGEYAAAIGDIQGSDESIVADQLFYYDDPKTIYSDWPQPVWDAVAAHTPTVGMSENQARMAAGIMIDSDSTSIGDRTVTYDEGAKKWTVTFVKNKATAVKPA
ncbi:MAG TPA: hypothetical protein VL346_11355 [Acidobacteriaceae bacterium]|nr:hypothetical protein [Acidobacteriaceae bacterium]